MAQRETRKTEMAFSIKGYYGKMKESELKGSARSVLFLLTVAITFMCNTCKKPMPIVVENIGNEEIIVCLCVKFNNHSNDTLIEKCGNPVELSAGDKTSNFPFYSLDEMHEWRLLVNSGGTINYYTYNDFQKQKNTIYPVKVSIHR